jgi:hypothetical protein
MGAFARAKMKEAADRGGRSSSQKKGLEHRRRRPGLSRRSFAAAWLKSLARACALTCASRINLFAAQAIGSQHKNSSSRLTWDNAQTANRAHPRLMEELIAKANQVILESQCLRREGRSLRFEASVLASLLGETIVKSRQTEREFSDLKRSLDQSLFEGGA